MVTDRPVDPEAPRRLKEGGRARPGVLVTLGLLSLVTGCVATWTPRTTTAGITLQWPFQPNPARLVYLRSLTGFAAADSAGATLRRVAIGEAKVDRSSFVLPVAVATGTDGRIAVADMGRRCVHLYLPASRRYLQLTGEPGARLVSPVGLAFDGDQRLLVSDSVGRLFAFDATGKLLYSRTELGGTPLARPTGLAFSPASRLFYLVDTVANQIHAVDAKGAVAFSFGERGEGPGQLNFPTHVFRAASGELFVTDALNFRVAIFDETGHYRSSFGHHGDGSGDFGMPKGIAVDASGVVYVVDGLFDNVQLFDRGGNFLLTLGGRGVDHGELWLPSGAFVSDRGELYVCDTYNRRVQIFRIVSRDGEPTHVRP